MKEGGCGYTVVGGVTRATADESRDPGIGGCRRYRSRSYEVEGPPTTVLFRVLGHRLWCRYLRLPVTETEPSGLLISGE